MRFAFHLTTHNLGALPNYLYEAYKSVGGLPVRPLAETGVFTDEDRDLFYKHLTGFDFAAQRNNSAVPVHFRNIKHIKNPILKLRYLVEVVFPGKEFMISKYGLQTTDDGQRTTEQRAKSKDGKKGEVSSSELRVQSKTSEIRTQNSILRTKFWWLWYGYRWWVAVRAIFSGKW